MRDIKALKEQGAINPLSFELVEYEDKKGESRPMYNLNFKATMTLVTGYDAVDAQMLHKLQCHKAGSRDINTLERFIICHCPTTYFFILETSVSC